MHSLESQLGYPLGDTLPSSGQAIAINADIKWLRFKLPFALNHINLWLLRDTFTQADGRQQAGWAVVDCCIDAPASRAQWEQIFATELEGLPILRVIVTHMHPDHVGLAHWLCGHWQVPLWMSATDYFVARIGAQSNSEFGGDSAAAYFSAHGLADPESVQKIRTRTTYYSNLVPQVPAAFKRMMDGDILAIGAHRWRCISGYGHSPEHIGLYCEETGILISGDMMLPRISTNISVYQTEPEANPLALFLRSIAQLGALPAGTLILPSHGKPFTGLHTRIAQLQNHHQARLNEVIEACRKAPCSAADIVPIMFARELDLHQITFALGEVIAHLNFLWHQQTLTRRFDADGVYRFYAA